MEKRSARAIARWSRKVSLQRVGIRGNSFVRGGKERTTGPRMESPEESHDRVSFVVFVRDVDGIGALMVVEVLSSLNDSC